MHRIAAAVFIVSSLHAQAPHKFEVASVKPSNYDGAGPAGIRPAAGGERYLASHVTLKQLITVAYRIRPDQVIGGPAWMDSDFYNMNAKAERPSSVEELHLMLQDLLAERFNLRFHRATKEMPIYALTVDKGGPKLKPHDAQNAGDPFIDQLPSPFPQLTWHATFAPMDYFAWRLSTILDRPVVDRTNLKGGYDFDLSFTMQLPFGPGPGAVPPGPEMPAFNDALRAQLGLQLDRQQGPVETLVIDQAEKPSGN